MIQKSANQLWRESGTTLSFKDWLTREKKKFVNFNGDTQQNVMMVNKPLNDTIQKTLQGIKQEVGYQTTPKNKSVFGINKNIIIIVGVGALALITYKIIKSRK